ncbi:serine/arginine-rich SC35-like splicing factor SCL28 isoform X1 [Carex rostrata]
MGKPSGKNDWDWYRHGGDEKQGDAYQPAATLPNSLFVRNIALETSADIIRSEFELFGPIRDVYLPKDFSTGMPKGYGFIKFQNGEDAKMAKEHLNHRVINGQEISIEYSSDSNRKKPRQMALINSGTRKRERSRWTGARSSAGWK